MSQSPKVTVYTTTYCGYCVMAKRLLDRLDIPYEEVDASAEPAIRQWLVQQSGQRTVPQIFFGDESIGGYQELAALDRAEGIRSRLGLDGAAPDA